MKSTNIGKIIEVKMKTRILKLGVALTSVLVMSACSGSWEEDGISGIQEGQSDQTQTIEALPLPRAASEIQLFSGGDAGQSFTILQDIQVAVNKTTVFNADPTVADVEVRLKASAAELGGDAVINVIISEVKVRALSWGGRTGTGTVIKY
ncbi:MAG: hypothetical protein ABJ139_04615 [Paracoccaceae bacterium]